ncbi:hypothetical protein HUT06_15340 [Actinomadura sp. NAK00032]|uniref:hypothetical protein n=1 Tax=Actinomadura sp. NAK00032 TaxID=2742128 RepID=UPI0015903687|nr:hypothetical protein [Actinomadura sp. NAK00032]QKW35241.1 hypothetical protein HUT06_15340 [Actinomadura sp. NAK00032]
MTARPEESLVREARDAALAVLARDDSAAEASRTLAGAVAMLADLLDAHRPTGAAACPACETAAPCPTMRRVAAALVSHGAWQGAPLDRGAAWACADAHFNRSAAGGARRLVLLSDLGAFYVARGVSAVLPEPPQVPVPGGETVLVLDKASGRTSRWPLLPDADLIVQYRRYLRGEPMILDGRPTAERPLRPRLFQRGAWAIRSSPIP